MRIPRVFGTDLPHEEGEAYVLVGEEAAHLSRVLRLKPGAEVEVFDGEGRAECFRVVALQRARVDLLSQGPRKPAPGLPFALTCLVAPPKGKRVHRLLEALSELGVDRFVPLRVSRSVGKAPSPEGVARWARESAKQCGRNRCMEGLAEVDLAGALRLAATHELGLLADSQGSRPLREALDRAPPASVIVVVGPEGGWSEEERGAFAEAGLLAVGVGPTTLRIETAAQAVVSAVVTAWADVS